MLRLKALQNCIETYQGMATYESSIGLRPGLVRSSDTSIHKYKKPVELLEIVDKLD